MRPPVKLGVTAAVVAVLLGGCYLQQGGWIMLNPAYGQARLSGLTSAQVVQRLGPATDDPRLPYKGFVKRPRYWASEAVDGPLSLAYYQGWGTCVIEFRNDRVVSVRRFWK